MGVSECARHRGFSLRARQRGKDVISIKIDSVKTNICWSETNVQECPSAASSEKPDQAQNTYANNMPPFRVATKPHALCLSDPSGPWPFMTSDMDVARYFRCSFSIGRCGCRGRGRRRRYQSHACRRKIERLCLFPLPLLVLRVFGAVERKH